MLIPAQWMVQAADVYISRFYYFSFITLPLAGGSKRLRNPNMEAIVRRTCNMYFTKKISNNRFNRDTTYAISYYYRTV